MPRLKLSQKAAPRNGATEGQKLAKIAETTRPPTLDELRAKHEIGTLERVKIEAIEHANLKYAAQSATNSLNRQKTQLKNAVKILARNEKLEPDDIILVGDEEYRYDVTHTEKIDVEKFYNLFKDGKITEEQFLKSISVAKSEAERNCGAHITNLITEVKDGKTADVRVTAAETPIQGVEIRKAKPVQVSQPALAPRPISANAKPVRPGVMRTKRKLSL